MDVVLENVSVETLSILVKCLERRRSELSLYIHRLRKELNNLKDSKSTSNVQFEITKDILKERENEEVLLLDLLKQL